jgi:hypothetical protein
MDTHPHVNSIKNTQNNIQYICNNIAIQHKIATQLDTIRHGNSEPTRDLSKIYHGATLVTLTKKLGLVMRNGKLRQDSKVVRALINKHKPKVVIDASGLGVGKTHGFITLMNEVYGKQGAILSHRRQLAAQTAGRANIAYHDDVKLNAHDGSNVSAFAGCIHSLPTLRRLPTTEQAFKGLFVLDESESIASEITQKYVKNEAETLHAIAQTMRESPLTVMADAHAGYNTRALLDYAGVNMRDVLVIETELKVLSGYTIQLYEDDQTIPPQLRNTKDQLFAKIIGDLKRGLKVTVVSLSKETIRALWTAVEQSTLADISKIRVDGDNSHETAPLLKAETYGTYQLVAISPSMSTGVSFDQDNADVIYVFAPNADGTGTPYDALQAMLRDRNPKQKTMHVYLQDSYWGATTQIDYANNQAWYADAISKIRRLNSPEIKHLLAQLDEVRPALSDAFEALTKITSANHNAKLKFKEVLCDELKRNGALILEAISNVAYAKQSIAAEIRANRVQEKKEFAENAIKATINAPKITNYQRDALAKQPDNVDRQETVAALEITSKEMELGVITRHRIESELVVDFDDMPIEEKTELVEQVNKKGLIKRLHRFDIMIASKNDVGRVVEIAAIGTRAENGKIGFAAKLSSNRVMWADQRHYGLIALKSVGVTVVDGLLVWNGNTLINPNDAKGWQSATGRSATKLCRAGLSTDLIETIKHFFGIEVRKTKRGYVINHGEFADIINTVNRRQSNGKNIVSAMLKTYNEYLDRNKTSLMINDSDDNNEYQRWCKAKQRLITGWIEAGRNKWAISPLYIANFRHDYESILGFDHKLIKTMALHWNDTLVEKTH